MWFSPLPSREAERKLLRKVMNITDVVSACTETGVDWFEQLLENVSGTRPLDWKHVFTPGSFVLTGCVVGRINKWKHRNYYKNILTVFDRLSEGVAKFACNRHLVR